MGAVVITSLLVSALVSGGISYGFATGLFLPTEQAVPNVTGLSLEAAQDMLAARQLRMVNRGEVNHDEIEEGLVAEQRPGESSVLHAGDEVTVRISEGPEGVEVPDVTGLLLAPARARLINAGLRPVDPPTEGGEGRPGSVASTDPAGGQRVARDSAITLTVVPEPRRVTVPDVTHISIRRAREAITEAELTVGEVSHRFNDLRDPNIVLEQTPAAGAEVAPGSAINLVVNEE